MAYADWDVEPVQAFDTDADIIDLTARIQQCDPLSGVRAKRPSPNPPQIIELSDSDDDDEDEPASSSSSSGEEHNYVPDEPDPVEHERRTPSPILREVSVEGGFSGSLAELYGECPLNFGRVLC